MDEFMPFVACFVDGLEDFGDFDDSNETDFFNGRMSQQYEVDPEIYDAKKKSSKTTIILVAILVVVVAVIVGIVVI